MQIAKALRLIVSSKEEIKRPIPQRALNTAKSPKILTKNLLTPLEETRIAIEEFVLPKKVAIDLLPRPQDIRKLQHELITHYQLQGISIGPVEERYLRIFPKRI